MNQKWEKQLPIDGIKSITPVAGGSINEAYEVKTDVKTYFLLVQPKSAQSFYDAEVKGLELFEEHDITAPKVIDVGEFHSNAYLLLSYLDEGRRGDQGDLGRLVAKLHHVHNEQDKFGFSYATEMDDVSFSNEWTDTWYEQFMTGRMDYLYEKIKQAGYWNEAEVQLADQVYQIMSNTLKHHKSKSSLLHGDLWAGNRMFLTDGRPALFDPAPLYGDREFDLGATLTFGGFNQEFYKAYDEAYPLEEGAWERIEFYNLYLLLVHLIKFGNSYAGSVKQSMRKIVGQNE